MKYLPLTQDQQAAVLGQEKYMDVMVIDEAIQKLNRDGYQLVLVDPDAN